MGKQWRQWQTIFLGSKITADGDSSHEIKRHLLLGRKVMTNLDSILKSRDITLPAKVRVVKSMVFLVVMCGCESWTIKEAECRRTDTFELWCWRDSWETLGLQGDLTSPSKWDHSCCSLEGLMLKLKLQYLAPWCKELTHLKRPWCWERLKVGKGDDRGWDG